MIKAYSYRRFSSPEQGKGRSKDRQLEKCQQYCMDNGLELATSREHTFLDEGKSAYKGEQLDEVNGQLARFLALVDNGSIVAGSYLIVESLDRLGRDRVRDALLRFMNLLSKGINIVTLSDGRVYREDYTEMELMLSILVMSRAHEESKTKAMRVGDAFRKKQQNAREHKTPMGGAIPLWLIYRDGKYTIDDPAAEVVTQIFSMCIQGHGKVAIAKHLNATGVLTFKARKAELTASTYVENLSLDDRSLEPSGRYAAYKDVLWGTSSVEKILRNRAVLGEYQPYSVQGEESKRKPNGDPISNYYPNIIDEATFYQAQAAIDGRRLSKATKQSANFNVWGGIAKCSNCGSAMHLVNKGKLPKGNKYLHCSLARKGQCKGKAVRLDHTEIVFREMLLSLDSIALVQNNAARISSDLAVLSGKLIEKHDLMIQYRAELKRRFTSALNDLIGDCELEIASLKEQQRLLQTALGSERITSQRDFLLNVDLVSFEGRSRANSLCKRLEVQVFIGSGYFVVERRKALLCMIYHEGKVHTTQLDDAELYDPTPDAVDRLIAQMFESANSDDPFFA